MKDERDFVMNRTREALNPPETTRQVERDSAVEKQRCRLFIHVLQQICNKLLDSIVQDAEKQDMRQWGRDVSVTHMCIDS